MWTGQDLNPLPPQCKCGALPGELPAHYSFNISKCKELFGSINKKALKSTKNSITKKKLFVYPWFIC